MPRFIQSIRFRLSLAIAVVVFSVGSFMIGGIYLRQLDSLEPPVLRETPVVVVDEKTGEFFETDLTVTTDGDLLALALDQERDFAYRQALSELRTSSYFALGLLFFVSFLAGWLLSGWVLRPVKAITAVAQDISATDLSRRIGLKGPDDELSRLAATFDEMLDRIERAFEDQRRFIHETSHELRNPLAIARTNLELGLTGDDPDELYEVAVRAKTATDRMAVMIDELLENARQQVSDWVPEPFEMGELAREAVADFSAAAAERDISLGLVEEPGGRRAVVEADRAAIRRALANLLTNAVRLAPAGSRVGVSIATRDGEVTVSVADEGPGISEADRNRVFDRFWRGETGGGGSGLGLSIVRSVVERHGGSIRVEANSDDGSTFHLVLPAGRGL